MTDKVQVNRAYLEGLERLHAHIKTVTWGEGTIRPLLESIPPKPEELIQMEGWDASVVGVYERGILWCRKDMRIFGPRCTTEDEVIRAGNAMLREIAGKVKP